MLMPVVQLRGTPCLHPCLLPFAGLSSGGLVAANPRQPLRAPWASARTVRQLLRHFGEQLERLEPAYQPGPGQPADRHPLYAQALALRQQHPSWGAGYIRVRLAGAADAAVLPSERTLQRWFRQQHQPPAAPGRRPSTPTSRATAPHDTWQMDAVEQLRLGSGQGVCWLRLVDEYSGAFLGTTVFPPLPVGPCPADRGAAAAADGVHPLGIALPAACGQRQAVGFVERSASRLGGCG